MTDHELMLQDGPRAYARLTASDYEQEPEIIEPPSAPAEVSEGVQAINALFADVMSYFGGAQ